MGRPPGRSVPLDTIAAVGDYAEPGRPERSVRIALCTRGSRRLPDTALSRRCTRAGDELARVLGMLLRRLPAAPIRTYGLAEEKTSALTVASCHQKREDVWLNVATPKWDTWTRSEIMAVRGYDASLASGAPVGRTMTVDSLEGERTGLRRRMVSRLR